LDETQLPDWMNSDEMRQVMGTLKPFSEKDRQHYEHQARQDCLREQHTIQKELKAERQEKEAALAELERLSALRAERPGSRP